MNARILAVSVGRIAPILVGDRSVPSGIRKEPVSALDRPNPIQVHRLGLEGDEQADLRVHGGVNKAVYMYPALHYPFWRTVRMQALQRDEPLPFGFLGENLTVEGLDEKQLWLGDELRVGSAAFWVTTPRLPCDKFNARMGFKHAAKMMWQSGYTGWYLSVKQEGFLQAGDVVECRPGAREVSLAEQLASARTRHSS